MDRVEHLQRILADIDTEGAGNPYAFLRFEFYNALLTIGHKEVIPFYQCLDGMLALCASDGTFSIDEVLECYVHWYPCQVEVTV